MSPQFKLEIVIASAEVRCEHVGSGGRGRTRPLDVKFVPQSTIKGDVVVAVDRAGERQVYLSAELLNLLTNGGAKYSSTDAMIGSKGYYLWTSAAVQDRLAHHLNYPPHNSRMVLAKDRNHKIAL